jgi:rRNA biogenesis protein RRP5
LDLKDLFYVGKSVNVRITELRPDEDKVTASIRQALPAAIAAEKLNVGDIVGGMVSQVHSEQVVVTIMPAQLTALLSLSTLANHRQTGIEELRKELKIGEKLDGLVVVSKNPTSGLLVLSTKRSNQPSSYGISKNIVSFESITPGEMVTGKVVNHAPNGTQIELPNGLTGKVHPCDATDDLGLIASGNGPLNIDDEVKCLVLKVNPHTRIIDLSTRQSRLDPENAGEVVDREISSIQDLKEGQEVRGLVKNVQNGLFVALGRSVVARVKIRELFDEVSHFFITCKSALIQQFVKDWQSQFENNQLVSGRILSVDHKQNFVEMTLRKNTSSTKKAASRALTDFEVDQKVTATVKKVEEYGLFLKIDGSEISGLCHKSEVRHLSIRQNQRLMKLDIE